MEQNTAWLIRPEGIFQYPKDYLDARDMLEPCVYNLMYTLNIGYYLVKQSDFALPEKVYGDTEKKATRIIKTFDENAKNMGVLLSGLKGSGKSLLMKSVALKMIARGIPTIVINQKYTGQEFIDFISNINQEVVICFDEFEKVYGPKSRWVDEDDGDVVSNDEKSRSSAQDKLLTLFDGTASSKKRLFILTCNSYFDVSEFFLNRPGRIRYHLKFGGLSAEFVEEYLSDVLIDKSQIKVTTDKLSMFRNISFDSLSAIVSEMNSNSESFVDVMQYLNVELENGVQVWDALVIDGPLKLRNQHYSFDPFSLFNLWIRCKDSDGDDNSFSVSQSSIIEFDGFSRVIMSVEFEGQKSLIEFSAQHSSSRNMWAV